MRRPPRLRRLAPLLLVLGCGAVHGEQCPGPVEPAAPQPLQPTAEIQARLDGRGAPDTPRNFWQYIIIHHSASASGNAAAFDRLHRAKGWDGVGYHFVIGNGKGSGDGELEITARWWLQKHGAHAGKLEGRCRPDERNCCNEFGIGICLVGNYQSQNPTRAQMLTLARVVAVLQNEFGIPSDDIAGHGHVKNTACPGQRFPWRQLFDLLEQPVPAHFAQLTARPTTERCLWCLTH